MLTNLKQVAMPSLLVGKTKNLLIAVVLAVLLIGSAVSVYAEVIYLGDIVDNNGNTVGTIYLSCGSSAGAYFYSCDNNGQCTDRDHSNIAAALCDQ